MLSSWPFSAFRDKNRLLFGKWRRMYLNTTFPYSATEYMTSAQALKVKQVRLLTYKHFFTQQFISWSWKSLWHCTENSKSFNVFDISHQVERSYFRVVFHGSGATWPEPEKFAESQPETWPDQGTYQPEIFKPEREVKVNPYLNSIMNK